MSTEVEDLTELETLFDEALPCDSEVHDTDKEIHDNGPGVWYITDRCPRCGDTETLLRCDKLGTLILAGIVDCVCTECGHYEIDARAFVVRSLRR